MVVDLFELILSFCCLALHRQNFVVVIQCRVSKKEKCSLEENEVCFCVHVAFCDFQLAERLIALFAASIEVPDEHQHSSINRKYVVSK